MRRALPSFIALPVLVATTLVFACSDCASSRAAKPPVLAQATAASAGAGAPQPGGLKVEDVDSTLRAAWQKEGVAPAARVDDARFLRRAYIDIVGTIPPPEVTLTFIDDPS